MLAEYTEFVAFVITGSVLRRSFLIVLWNTRCMPTEQLRVCSFNTLTFTALLVELNTRQSKFPDHMCNRGSISKQRIVIRKLTLHNPLLDYSSMLYYLLACLCGC
jgi:hypothetical protein